MDSKLIKITIITPVLNGEKTLQKTIDSIFCQNYPYVEYIIVDGLSTDKTHEIIKFNKKKISKILIGKDKNLYDAMNKGIKVAQGEIIGILNADDYYEKKTLDLVSKTYELSSKKNIIIYGDMFNEYREKKVVSKGDLSDFAIKSGNFIINHPSLFVSKLLYKNIGLYDIKYSSGADREFVLRAYSSKANFLKIKKPLATFRLGGFTSSYSIKIIINRAVEEFNIFKKYNTRGFALKKSFEQYYRMTRNMFLRYICGHDKFLKLRINRMSKK